MLFPHPFFNLSLSHTQMLFFYLVSRISLSFPSPSIYSLLSSFPLHTLCFSQLIILFSLKLLKMPPCCADDDTFPTIIIIISSFLSTPLLSHSLPFQPFKLFHWLVWCSTSKSPHVYSSSSLLLLFFFFFPYHPSLPALHLW